MSDTLRVVIAEDHPIFRDGLRQVIAGDPGLQVAGEAGDGHAALALIRSRAPAVALLDIGLPGLDGCAVAREVRAERLPVELVFLTVCDEPEVFETALELGVKGYLLKDATPAEILRCIRAVAGGQHYAGPAMATYLVEKNHRVDEFARLTPGLDLLTPQERTILRLVAQDKRSKEIAAAIGISVRTVDTHRANICQKLALRGNHVLSRFASRHRDRL